MNKKLYYGLTAVLFFLVLGGIVYYLVQGPGDKQYDVVLDQNQKILERLSGMEQQMEDLEEVNEKLESSIQMLQNEISATKSIVDEQIRVYNNLQGTPGVGQYTVYPVYTANIDTYEQEIQFYLSIRDQLPLRDKLQEVADKLSVYIYNSMPIEVERIEVIEEKQVAVINLKEHSANETVTDPEQYVGKTWKSHFFQGSLGGAQTSTNLIETFLQRDYDGEWIDGVQFLYQGESVAYQHVPALAEIQYQ